MHVPPIIPQVLTQHLDETAFLWLQRDNAIRATHYRLSDLVRHDNRVEAHIDGLRVAGDDSWELCVEQLTHEEPGEVFAAAVLALESENINRLERVLAVAETVPETTRGFISALGWVTPQTLRGTGQMFLNSSTPFRRRLGIAACAVHRVDPATALARALDDPDPALRARAAKAAGELGRTDLRDRLADRLRESTSDDDAPCRFWPAWSAVLLGDGGRAIERLLEFAVADGEFANRALALAPRAMEAEAVQAWLKSLVAKPEHLRAVIAAIGAHGDPHYAPWLIKQMATPELARPAGEAFAMITGVDIAYEDLEGEWPEGFEAGPTEDPADEDVAMDPDEDLPWPAPALIERWWKANGGRFEPGRRYLCGRPITAAQCRRVLATGFQRQRIAAALELALMDTDAPLFETRAPGIRQQRALGLKGRAA